MKLNNIHSRSVAILMKPDVRFIDYASTAGTERVAINDMLILEKNKVHTVFISAAKIHNWNSTVSVRNLFFPQLFLDKFGYLLSKPHNLFFYKFGRLIYVSLTRIFEFLYAIQFIVLFRNFDAYYVFQVPFVGFLAPSKTLTSFHGLNERTFYLQKLWKTNAHKTLMIFCSDYLRQQFIKKTKLPQHSSHMQVFHNVTSLPKTSSFSKSKNPTVRYGFIGSWSVQKGICILRDTIHKIESEKLPIEFYVAGSTDLWDQSQWAIHDLEPIRKSIDSLNQYKNVHIVGRINYQKRDLFYKKLDYLIFPSIWQEPFAVVIIEAMSYGIPVISFNVGGVPEIIHHEENGYILNPPSVEKLVSQIRKTVSLRDTKEYSRLQKAARDTISINFSDKTRYEKLHSLLFR